VEEVVKCRGCCHPHVETTQLKAKEVTRSLLNFLGSKSVLDGKLKRGADGICCSGA